MASSYHPDYPAPLFQLPIDQIRFYDDPDFGLGDAGWGYQELLDSIRENGLQEPIEVGRSLVSATEGDRSLFCFNGNHRLADCKKLGHTTILCVNSDADDAAPLTTIEIIALGGENVGLRY